MPLSAGMKRPVAHLHPVTQLYFGNQLFSLMSREARGRLARCLEPVRLDRQQVLFRAHDTPAHVYFPDTAVVSLVTRLESGQMLEVGLIGRDGVVGVGLCPGVQTAACDAVAQIPGAAHRLEVAVLQREFNANSSLHTVFGRYAELLFIRCTQIAVCNMFHSVEQRCVRWLLTVRDLVGQDEIPLTHEMLAAMLGVHRPTITLVIGMLHRAGYLEEERGRVSIVERGLLEAASCECYAAMRAEQRRLLGY